MKSLNTMPAFALEPAATWHDLHNAMMGGVEYQATKQGRILPLMLFAPMTEPENLDAWEPLKTLPENLLIVCIERPVDAKILQALQQAKATCGEVYRTESFPLALNTEFTTPVSEIYEKMASVGVSAFAQTYPGEDDPSFFFLRGAAAVNVFATEFGKVTRSGSAQGG